jgi:tetratricopeptide (TPR) repeat protein
MRIGLIAGLVAWTGSARAAPAVEADTLPVPPVPAVASEPVGLPAVPRFELPAVEGGMHEVRELKVRGRALLGTRLTVKGYITWIYDCALDLARPGVSLAETQRQIDDNPALCDRPSFYLGGAPRAAVDRTLWVVDVPRAANQRERIALNRAQLGARRAVPRMQLRELVAVTGELALASPAGERSSDGLLVYESLAHLAAPRTGAAVGSPSTGETLAGDRVPSSADAPAAETRPPSSAAAPPPGRATRLVVPVRDRNDSIEHYEQCNELLDRKQLGAATAACRAAVARWPGNHLAWYALGNAAAARDDWGAAREAYDRAVALRPDAAMYQLYDGIALYKLAFRQAQDELHGPPSELTAAVRLRAVAQDPTLAAQLLRPYRLAAALAQAASPTPVLVDGARRALATAARLAPGLWLASYYLGRLERDHDRPRQAAQALTAAIRADPAQAEPYVALIELYRAWDYGDAQLAVAQLASARAPAQSAALAYELGLAYQARGDDARALAAFTRAVRDGSVQALLERGQLYLRAGDPVRARRDVEAFLGAAGPELGQARQIARGVHAAITRKLRGNDTVMRAGGQLQSQ